MSTPTRRLVTAVVASAVALAVPAALLTSVGGTAVGAAGSAPADYRFLKAQVFRVPGTGEVAVGMPDPRTVKVQHRLDGEPAWSESTVLFRERSITCGRIEGRASTGGVALTLECDTPYYEDQAPARSRAAVTQDLTSWALSELPGEAYRTPGISPSGEHAAWLAGGIGSFVSWSAGSGFSGVRRTSYDSDGSDNATVVADDGTVTVAGGEGRDGRCVLGLHAVSPAGQESIQYVDFAPGQPTGCTELSVEGVSSTRITNSRYAGRQGRWVVGRPDEASPWVLLARAPEQAPGREKYRRSVQRAMDTVFSDVPGQPLLSVGSPDRRRVEVQAYDEQAQRWGPARVVYDHGFPGCAWDEEAGARSLRVHSLLMHCYPKRRASGDYPARGRGFAIRPARAQRVLLSPDGRRWRTISVGARPVTPSLDRRQVAAPGFPGTTIVSPSGFVRLRAKAAGRCEVVLPVGPDSVVRLDATRGSRGFPSRLQRWTGSGWRAVQRLDGFGPGRCRSIETLAYGGPGRFFLRTTVGAKSVRIERTADGYRVRLTRGV